MGVPRHRGGCGVSEGLWHDTTTLESFWVRQEHMGHQEWCLMPELGQIIPLPKLEPSKGGSALTTPTCPQHGDW